MYGACKTVINYFAWSQKLVISRIQAGRRLEYINVARNIINSSDSKKGFPISPLRILNCLWSMLSMI